MSTIPRCSRVSGEKTVAAATVILAAPGELHGVVATPDGTNAVVVTVYDNASAASGTVLASLRSPAASTAQLGFDPFLRVANGITINVTGTNAKVYVYYN